jgi:hypothetical protein
MENTKRYSEMQLSELKQAAKGRGIKHYYILPKNDLIRLLSADEIPLSIRIHKMTIHELRKQAKDKGIRGFWPLSRAQLVDLLYPDHGKRNPDQGAADQDQKNQCHTNEHDDPQKHYA